MNLQQAGKTLKDVQIGTPDAEADRKLAEYFLTTPHVEAALQLRRTLFLGRKGAGKSALFTQLPRLITEAGYTHTRTILVTPDQYAWSALRDYQEQGLLPEQAHSNAWKFTLAIEVAANLTLIADDTLKSAASINALKQLKKFVQENYGETSPTLYRSAAQLLKGIKSFNVSAFGFGAGLSKANEDLQITPQIIESILASISTVASEVGIVVALDKLDDSWEGSDQSKHLLIGLLKACKDVNDKYKGESPASGFSVVAFLRADIYEGLKFDDKDKYRAIEQSIDWTPELLRDMVQKRLPESVTISELFEPGEMRGSIAPFNYIVKRTFLRPREILQFMDECIRRAGYSATQITKDQIRQAEEKYSSWKVDDLKQEYRRLYPEFEQIVEILRQAQHRYDSFDEFEAHINQRAPDLVKSIGLRNIIERLFNASAIGVRLANVGSPRFRAEDSDLMLPSVGAIYVHQCLYKGLNLREKRARDDQEGSLGTGDQREEDDYGF